MRPRRSLYSLANASNPQMAFSLRSYTGWNSRIRFSSFSVSAQSASSFLISSSRMSRVSMAASKWRTVTSSTPSLMAISEAISKLRSNCSVLGAPFCSIRKTPMPPWIFSVTSNGLIAEMIEAQKPSKASRLSTCFR